MSIKATFWRYEKPVDSTARPSSGDTDKQEFDIVLKDAVSITAPVIELTSAALRYNYCYIPRFGRYYFVHSTTILTNDIIQYSLSCDVLATWRSEILASKLYVLRSASDYNLKLIDDTWTHTTDFTETVTSVNLPSYDETGCYIVTIVNNESGVTANPASAMYLMNAAGLAALLEKMYDDISSYNFDDLTQTYFNPGQYITSCKWLPFDYMTLANEQGASWSTPIQLGWFPYTGVGGYKIVNYGKTLTFTITIGSYTDWTDRDANWTRYALYVPGFGITEIDPQYSGQTLTGKISVDFNKGSAYLVLTTGTGQIAAALSGDIGADVALNQVGGSINIPTSKEGLVNSAIQFGGAFIAKGGAANVGKTALSFFALTSPLGLSGDVRAAAQEQLITTGGDVAKAAADAAKQTILNPTVTTVGADGARYTIIDNHTIYLYRRKYTHYNPAVAKLGGVCNQVKTLGNLSGYTQVANGLINMAGTIEERNAITSLLEGGFIIA